jgi:hypothetical protein
MERFRWIESEASDTMILFFKLANDVTVF